MDLESARQYCLSLPHVEEEVKWDDDLTFMIGGKMFAVLALEPSHGVRCSFKCTPQEFAELTERDGIIPAPYLARYHWVGLEHFDVLGETRLRELLRVSYQLVWKRLPKKVQRRLRPAPDPS